MILSTQKMNEFGISDVLILPYGASAFAEKAGISQKRVFQIFCGDSYYGDTPTRVILIFKEEHNLPEDREEALKLLQSEIQGDLPK